MTTLPTSFFPPMRAGVTASQLYLPKQPHFTRLLDYLCVQFPHISLEIWQQRFIDGLILNQHGEPLALDSPYLTHQSIFYYRHLATEVEVPFQHHILFENDEFLVVDKPHFLTVSPTGNYVQQTLLTRLKQQYNNPTLTPIHRLDRETAGILLISKNPTTRGHYQQLFAQQQINKTYHAIAPYRPHLRFPQCVAVHLQKGDPFYTMRIIENRPANSFTEIQLLATSHDQQWAKYQLNPHTGKQHQLRVHLNHLGIAIRHDPLYPLVSHKANDDFSQPLQLLAKEIAFIDPLSHQPYQFISQQDLTFDTSQ